MKKLITILILFSAGLLLTILAQPLAAQGYGGPLTFQGLANNVLHSSSARAMGGVSMGGTQDIGSMFQNPATLSSISSIQIALGGVLTAMDVEQEQNYAPVRYYPNLSLLLESRTTFIPNPDTNLVGFTAQDSVQRPYDDIQPNWSHSDNEKIPLQVMLAAPLTRGNFKLVAGIGAVEYANLNHFYQNNNVLSPEILAQRPLPTFRPTDDNPVEAEWQQSLRSRSGSINGYGLSLGGGWEKLGLTFGISGMILDGQSNDFESEVGRGTLTFFSNAFRVDSLHKRISKSGISEFSASELTLSSLLNSRHVSIGFSLKLPTTFTRKYQMEVSTDTSGTSEITTISGEDKLKLPLRGMIGLRLSPREQLTMGLEYEFRPYNSADYTDADGVTSNPWTSASLFRIGAEYSFASWFVLRGGLRGAAAVFQSEGAKIEDDPVAYTIYSAGIGLHYAGMRLNLAYEHALMKYQDVWASVISKNSERQNTLIGSISYDLPW